MRNADCKQTPSLGLQSETSGVLLCHVPVHVSEPFFGWIVASLALPFYVPVHVSEPFFGCVVASIALPFYVPVRVSEPF